MKRRPYPRYTPSGVEWLGDLPEHWDVRKFSREVSIAEGQVDPEREPYASMLLIGPEHVESGTGRLISRASALDQAAESGKYRCNRGSVIYSKIRPALRKVVIAPEDCLCSADMYPMEGRCGIENAFLYWLLLSDSFGAWSVLEAERVAMPKINRETISELRMPMPPAAEQRSIASFLDRETERIDKLVAKKRELIERLKEKRTALISRTVTRGLPPEAAATAGLPVNPPLKDSGVQWLGKIPAHWEVKQLKWAIQFQRGHDLPADEREEGTIPVVTSAGVSATHSTAAAKGPGIVTGRYGTIGQFHLVEGDYWPLNTTLYSVDLHGNSSVFLVYLLGHLSPLFLLNAIKSAVPGIDRNDIHPTLTVVPPLAEQRAIASYLDAETAKIDTLAAKAEEAIERLREYRTALITAAVTGKIDVRGGAAA